MKNKIERRKNQRLDLQWPVSIITNKKTLEGTTINITSNGMSILCDDPLPLDELFRFYIIPPDRENIDLTGRIVWSNLYGVDENNTSVGIGICFVEISGKDSRYFDAILSQPGINEYKENES